ncbi:MAG: L,D-transpeptidase [Vicinamibacteria bacterium]
MWIPAFVISVASFALPLHPAPVQSKPPTAFEQTLRLQVLLDRAHFSPGELDGLAGDNLQSAANAYKRLKIDGATLDNVALADAMAATDLAPILTTYVITKQDVAGPFVKIPPDMMKQSKLKALGYSSAIEGIGEKVHASPALLKRLNPRKRFVESEEIQVPNIAHAALGKAAKVVVNKADGSVTALDDQDAVMARYPATLGSDKDPLPIGDWKINGVSHNPPFHYNPALFWDSKPEQSKAVLPPGPNSPVGVVWIDLSKENMGIHGTAAPELIGKRQSHGCIRLTNWDAEELSAMVAPGIPAQLVEN